MRRIGRERARKVLVTLGLIVVATWLAPAANASTIESVTPTGQPSVGVSLDGDYTPVQLSSGGRYVAFMSYDGTLDAANPTTTVPAAYVRDRATGHSVLASVDGNGAVVGTVTGIELSGDGRTLAFKVTNDPTVYLRDLATGTTRPVGSAPAGSYFSLDDDGGILVTGDANAQIVHVYDTSNASQITQFPGFAPLISGDGTHIAYFDVAPQLQQIVELDLRSGERRVVGLGSHPSDFISVFPGSLAISRDGRYLVFASYPNLVATGASSSCNAPGNSCPRLYRADTLTGVFQRVDVVSGGGDPMFAPFGGVNQSVGISADGQVAYFSSPGDFGLGSPMFQSLYAHDFASGRTVLASPPTPDGDTLINPSYPAPSQDGRLVAFYGQARTPAGVLLLPQVYTTELGFQSTPSITWATPASITYGTPLGPVQLNATASVPGSFSYSPSAGTVLQPGTRTLTVTFTPTNTADYTTATASVQISVGFTQNCITTARTGPFVVVSGQSTCVANGGSIVGPVTIQIGGSLWMSGGSITGPVNATGAGALTLCGVRITGPVSVTGSIGYVLIGSPSTGCPGNVITGPVRLNQNTGGLGFSGNRVTGPVTITNNTGGYTYSGNTATGQVIQIGNS